MRQQINSPDTLYFEAQITASHQRSFGAAPNWLISLDVGAAHGGGLGETMPQARAVVDDYGTLVIVGGWL